MGIKYTILSNMGNVYTGLKLIFNTGGTRTKLAISKDGESLSDISVINTNPDPALWISEFATKVKEITKENQIGVVCGGIAGVFDEKKTMLLRSPHLPEWEKGPLKKKLEETFGTQVLLDNDVAMEGLGEAIVGAGRRKRIVGFVAIGTGVGGVKIEEGKICANAYGFEPGHQIIDSDGEVGYFEDFVSGSGMKTAYGIEPDEISDPQIWETETKLVAIGLHNVLVLWSPEVLILGGSVMKSIDLEALKSEIKKQMRIFPTLPEIVRGELGDKAGLYGALEYLKMSGRNN
jgi:glucokinase